MYDYISLLPTVLLLDRSELRLRTRTDRHGEDFSISQCSLNRNMRYSARLAGSLKLQVAIFPSTAIHFTWPGATGNDVTSCVGVERSWWPQIIDALSNLVCNAC